MIVCEVVLYPRVGEGNPDAAAAEWRGRLWFRRVPVIGESLALEDDRGESDWIPELASNVYRVLDVRWRAAMPEDKNPPIPLVVALRR